MKSLSELQTFYNENIASLIPAFEKKRKSLIPIQLISKILFYSAISIIVVVLFNNFFSVWEILPIFAKIIVLFIFFVACYSVTNSYIFPFLEKKYFPDIRKNKIKSIILMTLIVFIIGVLIKLLYLLPIFPHFGELMRDQFLGKTTPHFFRKFFSAFIGTFFLFLFVFISYLIYFRVSKVVRSRIKTLNIEFKKAIISPIAEHIDNNIVYIPDKYISINDFLNSEISSYSAESVKKNHKITYYLGGEDHVIFKNKSETQIIKYNGSDFAQGKINETNFEFSQLDIIEDITIRTSNKYERKTGNIYKGLLFKADFNKKFYGKTYVFPESLISLRNIIDAKGLVKLENIEFEEFFEVHSSDQIEARYILTPSFMEKIVEVRKKFNRSLSITFIDSCIYISIPMEDDIFAPHILGEHLGFKQIEEYYTYLELLYNLVNELNLNIRIWTK